jgi:Ca2+-transporting ATPase
MVTDTMPAVALALEKPSAAILSEKPRPGGSLSMKAPIFYSFYLSIIGIVIGMLLYLWGVNDSPEKARTLLFSYLVFQEVIFCFSVRSQKRIWQSLKEFFANSYLNFSFVGVIILQIIIFFEPFRKMFGLSVLSLREIIILVITILLTLFFSEIVRSKISHHLEENR